jgi:hypothetical protein
MIAPLGAYHHPVPGILRTWRLDEPEPVCLRRI